MATSDVLSKDEVDSLLEKEQNSQFYDFTEPLISQIEHGQMFRVLDTLFIDELTSSLDQFLHIPVNLKHSGIEISRYDKFVASIKHKIHSYHAIKLIPDTEHLLLSIEQSCIYHVIELLFGGRPGKKALPEKTIAPIEMNVANKFVGEINAALAKAWESIAHKQVETEQSSSHPLRLPICMSGEKVVVIKYELTMRDTASHFAFCFPIKLFDFKTQREKEKEHSNDPEVVAWQAAIKANVLNCPIELKAVLSTTKIKLHKIRNLKVGDVIPISSPRDSKLIAENVPIFTGKCCTQDDTNVIKIDKSLLD